MHLQVHGGKQGSSLSYSAVLDLAPYCTQSITSDGWGTVFYLRGVILHLGETGGVGHYVYLQLLPDGMWLRRDDTEVTAELRPLAYTRSVAGLVYQRQPPDRYAADFAGDQIVHVQSWLQSGTLHNAPSLQMKYSTGLLLTSCVLRLWT